MSEWLARFEVETTAAPFGDFKQLLRFVQSDLSWHCCPHVLIMSDSDAIPSDQIVRMCVPTERQPYDRTLQDFRDAFHRALAEQNRERARPHAYENLVQTHVFYLLKPRPCPIENNHL